MEPVDLSRVERFRVRSSALGPAQKFFLHQGKNKVEACALLAGRPEDERTFVIDRCFIPEQVAHAFDVTPHRDSMKGIHAELYRIQRVLSIQIHTHPGSAFHSDTDNEDTTLTQNGCLSIVVPYFGLAGLGHMDGWAVFRRHDDQWCGPMSGDALNRLIVLPQEAAN